MRLAILSWRDTTHPDGGGSEVFLESVGLELVSRGHQVTLVCARYPGSSSLEDRDGLVVRRMGGRLTVYPRALAWTARRRWQLDAVIDVVNGLPFATPLVRRAGVVALVHHLHREQWHIIYPGLGGRIGWFVESRLVPLLYRRRPWLTVSESSARELTALGVPPDRITIARNGWAGISLDTPESATPRLCVLARLVPHKQIEHAFEVVARLAPDHPALHLDVIGDGWWRDQLEAAAARLGVTDRVTFHGHVPDPARDGLLGRAWLMLLPSVKEGWGLAVTEAGAQGTATIGYRAAGGVNESIHDGKTGVLVDDLDQMVRETRRLLAAREERERLGRSARRLAHSLTWEATADVVEDLLGRETAGSPAGTQSP